jgi:5-methyltetrahydropteroyltriglutamate--homocysteine methyltransferase
MRQTPPFRAEHVGSLLRPRTLKDAARRRGESAAAEATYRNALDGEVARAVALQESVGLRSLTDGEFGRASWFGFFFERAAGFEVRPSLYTFHDGCGHDHAWSTCFAAGKIRRTGSICGEEFQRLRRAARAGEPKVTMPSPSALHFFRGREAADPAVYPDMAAFWDDLAAIYRAEIEELGQLGCRYLQLDEVPLAMLCDPSIREQAKAQGLHADALVDAYVAAINRALAGRPAGMTVAMHLCRGNFRSRWMASGGYEPVAEKLFGAIEVDAFLLEYDSPRAGDFAPLRFLPAGKLAVLGLVSTKTPELESKDALKRRIDEAARHAPLESLCLSPQCGFASVAGGNALGEDDQRRKLELVVETAREVWG